MTWGGGGWVSILLSKRSQTDKDKYYMIALICGLYKTQQTGEYNKKEADSLIWRTNQWLPAGRGRGREG